VASFTGFEFVLLGLPRLPPRSSIGDFTVALGASPVNEIHEEKVHSAIDALRAWRNGRNGSWVL
jgi:hypothetical protein